MDALSTYRTQLEKLDTQLLAVLRKRLEICQKIGAFKAEMDIPAMQPGRVSLLRLRAAQGAVAAGIREPFALALYDLIISEDHRVEEEMIEERSRSKSEKVELKTAF